MADTASDKLVAPKEIPQITKIRRRIEDRLRKDDQAVMTVAEILKVRVSG
jgi:hypothetical protein